MGELRVTTVSNDAGTGPADFTGQAATKVFVSCNQFVDTTVYDSLNVSSTTDTAAGKMDINFTNNMDSTSYSAPSNAISQYADVTTNSQYISAIDHTNRLVSSMRNRGVDYNSGGDGDPKRIDATTIGDLA